MRLFIQFVNEKAGDQKNLTNWWPRSILSILAVIHFLFFAISFSQIKVVFICVTVQLVFTASGWDQFTYSIVNNSSEYTTTLI